MRRPNFENILKVLNNEVPERPTLFEFFLNGPLYERLTGEKLTQDQDRLSRLKILIKAFKKVGYDYVTLHGSDFTFPSGEKKSADTISLNDNTVIPDRKSFEKYNWPDPENYDYSILEKVKDLLPAGMKVIAYGPGGVLENVIALVGYENLCYLVSDDPDLVQEIFKKVGSRLVKYYEICAQYESVGALISNDDWGFKTQTMLSTADMRKYVFPWHKKIVKTIHEAGKPAILHSCGNLNEVMEDVIQDMKFDAKHSFEDIILPVEEAYEKWGSDIAILGGIDVDFVCQKTAAEIRERSKAMLERTQARGGYALGTGNSVPEYVPDEKFLAMISVVKEVNLEN